jgi:hypothetical protein
VVPPALRGGAAFNEGSRFRLRAEPVQSCNKPLCDKKELIFFLCKLRL